MNPELCFGVGGGSSRQRMGRTPKMSSRACFQGWGDGGGGQRTMEFQK